MSHLINSIVRGFGMTLGRKAANKITSNSYVSSDKNYLTFWEGIKTIFWFFPNMLLSMIITMIIFGGNINNPKFPYVMLSFSIFFTLIIGYGYYNKKK